MWSSARSFSIASAPTRELGTSLTAGRSAARPRSRRRRGPRRRPATGRRVRALRRPVGELVAVELLAVAVALDDDQPGGLDALVGREPGACTPGTRGDGGWSPTRPGPGSRRPACHGCRNAGSASDPPASSTPLSLVVCLDDTTTCGVRSGVRAGRQERSSRSPSTDVGGHRRPHRVRRSRAGDAGPPGRTAATSRDDPRRGLRRVAQVERAALERRLRLEVAAAAVARPARPARAPRARRHGPRAPARR